VTEEQLEEVFRTHRQSYAQIGDVLVRENMLSAPKLYEAEARFSARTHTVGRFGDFLIAQGYITADQLSQALRAQKASCPPLREVLCQLGFATPAIVDAAARELAEITASHSRQATAGNAPGNDTK